MLVGDWLSASGDIKYSMSRDLTTLTSLVTIGIVLVEICFYFVT